MSVLSRFEDALEALFEGGARRLFRAKVQPVEVIRSLERAMLDGRVVVPGSVLVPNRFEVRLNPMDFAELAALNGTVEREAALHLERTARDQGLRAPAPFLVQLVADPTVGRSRVHPTVLFDESASSEVHSSIAQTSRMPPLPAGAQHRTLLLVDEQGRQKVLGRDPLTIGRALDNDLVVRDVRVSRHHAVVTQVGAVWMIRDLQSTNGTFVEGRRVHEKLIDAGCELSMGGYRLYVRKG